MHWKSNPDLYKPWLRGLIQNGRGIGTGLLYKSWLTAREVRSRGTSFKVKGIKIPRVFQLLSELELIFFFLLERLPHVVDIRENFPIFDIDWTVDACRHLHVRHLYKYGKPWPFTIDFVITEKVDDTLVERAASIKSPEDAVNPEIQQRLRVEYYWCERRPHIPWVLEDTSKFGEDTSQLGDGQKQILSTLKYLRAWSRLRYQPDASREIRFENTFASAYERNVPLEELLQKTARSIRVPKNLASDMFRYCAWHNRIPVVLTRPLSMNRPLILE